MSAREAESALRSALAEGRLIAEGMRGSGLLAAGARTRAIVSAL
jgi:hypothetical protein